MGKVTIIPATRPYQEETSGITHIIALHGLGASITDLQPLASSMHLPHLHWHFMSAPSRPVSINGGVTMPAWFDIYGFKESSPTDIEGIHSSCRLVNNHLKVLIEQQGIAPENIALLGFSQGGVIALHAGLSVPWHLGAIIGLSTWFPAKDNLTFRNNYQNIPIWLGHGSYDDVVPYSAAERAKQILQQLNITNLTLTHWPVGHSIYPEEISVLKTWLQNLTTNKEAKLKPYHNSHINHH